MKIQYFGHSAFRLIGEFGYSILTDPYRGKLVGFDMPEVKADVVTISHTQHSDHNFAEGVSGEPAVVDVVGNACADDIAISSFKTFHDDKQGSLRGENLVFCFLIDGIKVAHLGDLGEYTKDTSEKLLDTDVLLIPVGGKYTIDYKTAKQYIDEIAPKIVIPMHYKTADGIIDVDTVDNFLSQFESNQIRHIGDTLNIETLEDITELRIYVMERFAETD